MIVISAWFRWIACRYDGNDNLVSKIEELLQKEDNSPHCPEVLGGLPTPSLPLKIWREWRPTFLDGKAKSDNKNGEDVTAAFRKMVLIKH